MERMKLLERDLGFNRMVSMNLSCPKRKIGIFLFPC